MNFDYTLEFDDTCLHYNLKEGTDKETILGKMCQCCAFFMDEHEKIWVNNHAISEPKITTFKIVNNKTGYEWNFVTNNYGTILSEFNKNIMPNSYMQKLYRSSQNFSIEVISVEPIYVIKDTIPYDSIEFSSIYQEFFNLYDPSRFHVGPEFLDRITSKHYKDITLRKVINKINKFNELYPNKDYHCIISQSGASGLAYHVYYKDEFKDFLK